MHYDFVITLRREKNQRTYLAGIALLLFSFLAFLSAVLKPARASWLPGIAAIALLAGLIVTVLQVRRGNTARFRYWLLAAAAGWLLMPYGHWLAIVFLPFAIWENRAGLPLRIGFGSHEVVIEGFISRHIPWSGLQSVILKDGLLTLDFRNNRLLQREEDPQTAQDETAFNAYCRERLGGDLGLGVGD